jgi:superfamily II DNA/RNA helicase
VDNLSHKNRLLGHVLQDETLKQAIVFTATKRDADTLADNLSTQGYDAAALHGDMNQRERTRTLTKLRRGGLQILVATDVAARGIDVTDITHVINFDLPKFAEDYVHRIGRTGRAGASGIAVSFASGNDKIHLKRIERFTGQCITSHVVPGMEPRFKPRPATTDGRSRRTPPSITQKRSRTWSNDNGNRQNFNSANGNRSNSHNRPYGDDNNGNRPYGNEHNRGNSRRKEQRHKF